MIKASTLVQGVEVSEAAYKVGLAVVDGTCPTIGFAGGYTRRVAILKGFPDTV